MANKQKASPISPMMLHFTIARIDPSNNSTGMTSAKPSVGQRESERIDSAGKGHRTFCEIVFNGSRDNSQLRSDNKEISGDKTLLDIKECFSRPLKAELRAVNFNSKDQQVPTFLSLRRVFHATRERENIFCRLSFISSFRSSLCRVQYRAVL